MRLLSKMYFLSLMIMFIGCKDENKENNDLTPEIEWISGETTTTFTYTGGVISGYTFYSQFNALSSGEIKITAEIKEVDVNFTSAVFSIQKGYAYTLSLRANNSDSYLSSPGNQCLTVVFSTPASSISQEIPVESYLVPGYNEYLSDQYYCPSDLLLGEIEISE